MKTTTCLTSLALLLTLGACAPFDTATVGSTRVRALQDGVQPAVSEALTNIEPARLKEALHAAGEADPASSPVNAYVFTLGGRVVLVDAGGGNALPPYQGQLAAMLRGAGYAPEQVTDILITHMHADHVGGLLDGGAMQYPNATVHVHAQEAGFWLAPALPERAPAQFRPLILAIQSALRPYTQAGRVRTFGYGAEILPGVFAQDAGGHTPGHTVFLWKQEGAQALFWGDLIHVAGVQLARLDVGTRYDSSAPAAAQARQRWLAASAREGWTVFGAHMPYPGIGTVVADGDHFRWVPGPAVP